jgi:purine catabolism regulator
MALPTSDLGCTRYVASLRETGVAALALGVGPTHPAVPTALAEACRRQDLPLLVVPPPTPFLTITQTYWRARTHSAREELREAISGHHALTNALLADDPDGEVVRTLATVLRSWVATLDGTGAVERVYPVGQVPRAAAAAGQADRLHLGGAHSSASFDLGSETIAMLPLTVRDRVAGQLVVGSDHQLRATERRLAVTASALLSLTRARRSQAGAADTARRQAVAALLDMGQLDAANRLVSRFALPYVGGHVRVVTVRAAAAGDRAGSSDLITDAVLGWTAEAYPGPAGDDEPAWFLVPGTPADPDQLEVVLRELDSTMTAVLSAPVPTAGLHEVRVGLQERVGAVAPGTLDRPRVPADPGVAPGVDRLVAHRRGDLVGALAAYLRHRGHWDSAARELRVHRNTLRHRIGRCREVSGLDLDDADTAAELWLHLRQAGLA